MPLNIRLPARRLPAMVLGLMVALVLVLSGCTATAATPAATKGPIKVGSKIDTEGALLGQMIILMLKNNGFQVVDKTQTGQTQIVRQALLTGEIDMYPEYTGNGEFFFQGEADPAIWKDAQKGYDKVRELDLAKNNIVWLQAAPANNTWAIAIPKSMASGNGIRDLNDFAAYVNKGGNVKLIASVEFVTTPAALPAFEDAYGFHLKPEQLVTISTGNTALTENAAAEGTDGVNAAMAYGTDGNLAALNLVVLADPRAVQPVYEPAPTVRGEVMDKYPEIAGILNPVFGSLTLETLQGLNGQISSQGQAPADVAQRYLKQNGFLK